MKERKQHGLVVGWNCYPKLGGEEVSLNSCYLSKDVQDEKEQARAEQECSGQQVQRP